MVNPLARRASSEDLFAMEFYPETIVYLFCHQFGEEWEDKPTDPLFGRIPVDARFIEAPMQPETLITEKSTGEQIVYASIVWLRQHGYFELTTEEAKGWNFELYDQVFCKQLRELPDTPVISRFSEAIARARRSWLLSRQRQVDELGVPCRQLVTTLRKFRWFRTDPYRYVCDRVRQPLVDAGFFELQQTRVAGPIMMPKLKPIAEKAAEHQICATALQADLAAFKDSEPELAETLYENVTGSMLKMRCDEEYMLAKDNEDDGASGDAPI